MYYGWRVVFLTAVIFGLVVGSTYSAFGLFVLPVAADLNLSRAEVNTARPAHHVRLCLAVWPES